jgi:hypothetical protein
LAGKRLELPDDFLDIVGTHHAELRPDRFDIVQTIRAACRLADTLGFHVIASAPPADPATVLRMLPQEASAKLGPAEDLLVELAGKINAVECSLI